jgi:hypothetical protein
MKLRIAVIAVILAVIAGSCSAETDQTPENLTCVHFTNVLDDMLAKRLTEAEILRKLEEVKGHASMTFGRIRSLPGPMLEAARNGSWGVVADTAELMVMACAARGTNPWSQRYQRPDFSSTDA